MTFRIQKLQKFIHSNFVHIKVGDMSNCILPSCERITEFYKLDNIFISENN